MESERVWRPRTENERVWRPRMEIEREWRTREHGDYGWRSRENGDFAGKARVPCAKGDNGTPLDFGPGEEMPHLGSGAAHRRATSITGISGTAAVGRASIGSGT